MSRRNLFLTGLLTVVCFIGSCQAANGNGANGIDSLKIRNFVIKGYISLLNKKPSKEDVEALCGRFSLFKDFEKNKVALIDSLIGHPDFYNNIINQYRFEYLQGTTFDQIADDMAAFKVMSMVKSMSDFWDVYADFYNRLLKLTTAEEELRSNKISLPETQKRFFRNKFYDEINMGADNFVISTFNYLFFRQPTKYELEEGKKMVTGKPAILFFKEGRSKDDYVNIVFSSQSYQEGQVRYWYNFLLGREPSVLEIMPYLDPVKPVSIQRLIRDIVLMEEYSGLSGANSSAVSLKTKMKSPGALISIANSDINGSSINVSKVRRLEGSYNANGDKDVIDDLILRSLIYKDKSKAGMEGNKPLINNIREDSDFMKRIESCPHICVHRTIDPLLVCMSVAMAYADSLDLPLFSAAPIYFEWQKKNTPHSPWGINESNNSTLNEEDKLKWDMDYVKNWVKTYPSEYEFTLEYYYVIYNRWVKSVEPGKSTGKDLFLSLNSKFELLNASQFKAFFDPTYFKEEKTGHNAIPSMEYMRNNTTGFIKETYESLLFREPTPDELTELSAIIKDDRKITPEIIFYSLMSSTEYKYY